MFPLLKQRRLRRAQDLPSSNVSGSSSGSQPFDHLCQNCSSLTLCFKCHDSNYIHDLVKQFTKEPIQNTESSISQGISMGCRLCAMRIENSDANTFETLGDSFHMTRHFSVVEEFKAPGEDRLANWSCFKALGIKMGDLVPSFPEGLYFLLLC